MPQESKEVIIGAEFSLLVPQPFSHFCPPLRFLSLPPSWHLFCHVFFLSLCPSMFEWQNVNLRKQRDLGQVISQLCASLFQLSPKKPEFLLAEGH